MSTFAKESEYVTYEWSFALGADIEVIPLLTEKADLHSRISRLHYIDCSAMNSDYKFPRLIEDLKKLKSEYNRKMELKNNIISKDGETKINIDELQNLFECLSSTDDYRRNLAVTGIVKTGKLAVPGLVNAICNSSWWGRQAAVQALGFIGDTSVVNDLIEQLEHEEFADVRNAILSALRRLNTEDAMRIYNTYKQSLQFDKQDNYDPPYRSNVDEIPF